ncbi:MAG: hypothetical protein ACLRS8_02545 [Parabacteroides merdae]
MGVFLWSRKVVSRFGRTSSDAPIADVYNVIISDLRNAAENLPEKASVLGRATRYSAAHLLAKVYLTRGSAVKDARGQKATDMDSTLYYAEQVINSGAYALQENFSSLWDIKNQGTRSCVCRAVHNRADV